MGGKNDDQFKEVLTRQEGTSERKLLDAVFSYNQLKKAKINVLTLKSVLANLYKVVGDLRNSLLDHYEEVQQIDSSMFDLNQYKKEVSGAFGAMLSVVSTDLRKEADIGIRCNKPQRCLA
jgi:hypothetical protein